jgi:phosphodiesterase/alkaline phosphatase D-like protein
MSRLLVKLVIAATVGILLSSSPTTAQILPPAQKAARVKIIYGPALEIAHDDVAIIRWITNNPGGLDDHFSVADYGTNPKDLSQTAKSQIRLNRAHPETIFRVRIAGLKPRTTYYYRVTSEDNAGTNDRVKSRIHKFTMPALGERIINSAKNDGTLAPGPQSGIPGSRKVSSRRL